MSKISQAQWKKYVEIMANLSLSASQEFEQAVVAAGGYANLSPKYLTDIAFDIVTKYGEGSSALTASLYDALAQIEGAVLPPADVYGIEYQDVAKTVDAVLRDYTNMEYMNSVVGKMVKQVGADTMVKNAIRDGAQVAWVPQGMTCAFCITLASRGWQYVSKRSLKNGHAEHIHPKCDCQYCVRFTDDVTVEGYEPDEYKKMYYGAEGRTPKDKINAMRRQFYADDKAIGEGTNNSELFNLDE
jgi:hypothetical protein